MSSIYYPESWMQHPEVLRLQQRVRDLEQENEDLNIMVDSYREEGIRTYKMLDLAKTKNGEMFEKMQKFNSLSPLRKMFYFFKLNRI